MTRNQIEKILEQAIRNGEGMLIEGGSVRIGFTDQEVKTMAQVVYDDLVGAEIIPDGQPHRSGQR